MTKWFWNMKSIFWKKQKFNQFLLNIILYMIDWFNKLTPAILQKVKKIMLLLYKINNFSNFHAIIMDFVVNSSKQLTFEKKKKVQLFE